MPVTNRTMSAYGSPAAFELSAPPMIGLLPATTVVYILLGLGAFLPIILLTIVAVTLCVRRRNRKSSSDVSPVDAAAAGCHTNTDGFDVDVDDIGVDDVFEKKKPQDGWNASQRTTMQPTDFGADYRRNRIAEMGGKMQVHASSSFFSSSYFSHPRSEG